MSKIRILPEKVASQIAAGEIIHRPASVVKELIDNCIDAGADRIDVRIEKGGKGLIRVRDNGAGMSRDDLLLCVERHATSKIASASDLLCIKSLGFRGEALPSITSVSRTHITSRIKDALTGHVLKIAGGRFLAIEETGAPGGTVVEVRDLFFNLPARRNFLHSVRTEADHVCDVILRAALPLPSIRFKLDDSGKSIMNLPASGRLLSRISALLGRNVAESMIEMKESTDTLTITAYLAPWDLSRTRSDRLFVYINGRNVRDRIVNKAVLEGYGQRLMKGRFPQAVILIDIDPAEVDINIHPAKQEVRFHNSHWVFQSLVSVIGKVLDQHSRTFIDKAFNWQGVSIIQDQGGKPDFRPVPEYPQAVEDKTPPHISEDLPPPLGKEYPQVIGQLGNTYILCQVRDGLILADQHAAHERVVYESLKKELQELQIEVQGLLIPREIELTTKEKSLVFQYRDLLYSLGIEIDHFGGNTFLLRSVPALLSSMDWQSFLSELILELEEGKSLDEESLLDKILTVMACHGSIRAGHRMTDEEMARLMVQLEEADLPTNCPHGRPIFRHFSFNELEKMFKRTI
jgi:DNA mismatch repair protein MutL